METAHAVLIGYQNEVILGYVTGYYIYIYIYIYIIKNINDNIYLLLAEFSVCDFLAQAQSVWAINHWKKMKIRKY